MPQPFKNITTSAHDPHHHVKRSSHHICTIKTSHPLTVASSSHTIKVIFSDGKLFSLKQDFLKKANMLKRMLSDFGFSNWDGNFPKEGGKALETIVKWLTLHETEEPKTEEQRQMHRFNRNVVKEDVALFDKCFPRDKLAAVINPA